MNLKTVFLAAMLLGTLPVGSSLAATPKPLPNPDRPAVTPRMAQGAAVSSSNVCPAMKRLAGFGNSAPGLRVKNLTSGKTICSLHSRSKRVLASNTKIFTTSTTLGRLGPNHRYRTRVFASGRLSRKGVLRGNLYLKGGGDPSFGQRRFLNAYSGGEGASVEKLAYKVRKAGIKRITGRVIGDETVFDSRRGVPDSGYATSPYVGPLSGLSFNAGYTGTSFNSFSSNPARLASQVMARELRKRGINVRRSISLKKTPKKAMKHGLVARLASPNMAWMARMTNKDSNNFYAEMLLKNLGAKIRNSGSTRAGTIVTERYARSLGSSIHQVDGSGLTSTNRASAADTVKMLARVRTGPFVKSLPVAGRDGTLRNRMRGSAAQGNCHAKTGTISGVSALSGYCLNGKRKYAFSILMNGVRDLNAAHRGQDKIADLIAKL
ncbi:MAG: D-alanyl-D-alanine carboxypeptidase [Solirubrobacterales bacterium]|nr:D-alanyl-D-alanine carboxypeptidase [Solirubrobacterales bacterium]